MPLIIESINDVSNALSSFFPSRGDTKIKDLDGGREEESKNKIDKTENKSQENLLPCYKNPVFWYILFHCSAYLAFGIMSISIWGRRLVNYLESILIWDNNKYIFWGQELDERCLILGQDIYNNVPHSQIVISLFDDRIANYIDEYRLYDTLNRKNLMLQIYDANSFPYNSLFAPYHFFISNDEAWNIKGCMKLLEERKKHRFYWQVDIYIRLGEGEKKLIYEGVLNALSQKALGKNVNLHVFNESELIARDFINKYPTLLAPSIKNNINSENAMLKTNAKLHVLMIGFGWQGRQLLSHMVTNSQFLIEGNVISQSPLFVDIVDKREEAFNQYKKLRDFACIKYHLNFFQKDVLSKGFIEWLDDGNKLMKYDRVIISLGDDILNLEGFVLMHKLHLIKGSKEHLEIFVKQNSTLLEYFNNDELDKIKDIDEIKKFKKGVFGTLSTIYTKDVILDEKIDKIAKNLHYVYSTDNIQNEKKIDNIVQQEWQQTTLYNKQSSRAQAEGVKNLLLLLGYKISSEYGNDDYIVQLDKRISRNECLLKNLAENEHLRWMAYMLMQGIRPWYINSQTTFEEAKENDFLPNQVKFHYRHGCLIDFNIIPLADKKLYELNGKEITWNSNTPSPSQKLDYKNIAKIPLILQIGKIYIQNLN